MAAGFQREVHAAIMEGKLACSHSNCLEKTIFYQKSGILEHYKTVHGPNVPSSFLEEARTLSRKLHGDETKTYLERIYEKHVIEVRLKKRINVVSNCCQLVESIFTNLRPCYTSRNRQI